MASKGKERENFFRINVLVVDHIKKALVDMLKYYLCQKNMSFEDFIDAHVTDIKYLKKKNVIYGVEVSKLIVNDKAISDIIVDDLEVTLVKRLLDNLCPDLFMDDGCKTLQDFLKKNRHAIYHLFKFNERCCQCSHDYKFPVTSQLLQEDQYKKLFKSSPCTNCAGTSGTVCSVSSCIVTEYIKLDYKIRKEVFGHFSPIFKVLQKFTAIRNEAYGHKEAAVISNECYDVYLKDIEENIMVLARICGNEDQTRLALDDVQKRSCDDTLCIQYNSRIKEQIQKDLELREAIGGNSQTLQESSQMLHEVNKMVQENSQILQRIDQQLQKLTEQGENSKATETNLTKAQQFSQVEPVSGTSGVGYKRLPPTTSQQDQSVKKKPKKSNNENEEDVSTMLQKSDESDNPFPVHTINHGRTNYTRLGLVVVNIFPNILREIMRFNIAPDVLYRHIRKQHKNNSSVFDKALTNRTYDNIDFTLLYKLMRWFSILDDPKQGWEKLPTNTDVTISDDVERLRFVRNNIVHRLKADIDIIEMSNYFSNIISITQRIDTYLGKLPDQGFAREVLNFQTHCMDSEMEQKYHQALKDIEDIKEIFSEANVNLYYGKTFSNFIQDVKNKARSSVIPICLVLQYINDDEKPRILNGLKTEINLGLVNVKFK